MEERSRDKKLNWGEFRAMLGPSFKGTGFGYAAALFFILLAALAQAAEPVIYGRIVDAVISTASGGTGGWRALLPLVGWWALAALAASLFKELGQLVSWRAAYGVLHDFVLRSVRRVLSWDPEKFGRVSLGALAKRLDRAWDASWLASSRIITDVTPTIITFFVFLTVGFYLDWRMTLVTLSGVPLLLALTLAAYRFGNDKQAALDAAWDEAARNLSEVVQNIVPVKAFAAEDTMLRDQSSHMDVVTKRQNSLNWVWTALELGNSVARLGARMAVIVVGLFFVEDGSLTVGTLITFFGMVSFILAPFDYLLADIMQRVSEIRSAFGQVAPDWFTENKLVDNPRAKHLRNVRGELALEGVSVRYQGAARDALHDLTLRVRAGTSLAIVGPSGSGKSTLVKLVNRFMEPYEGRVLIDGSDLADYKVADVRRAVGVVQQETVLFNDTVLNNIRLAKSSASDKEVFAACKQAQAHEFIKRLKNGYHTTIGERGARLSGGERQRIALARIFLADPPILVLDESTSALDSETEHKLQLALRSAMENRTTLIVAHRLSTVYMADQIAVIEHGKLVELGTHTDLIREGGIYQRLWRLQSGGYLPD